MNHQPGGAGLNAEREALPLSSSPSRPTQIGRITAAQARMARAATGKTQGYVAQKVGCALGTVCMCEQNPESISFRNAEAIVDFTKIVVSSLSLMPTDTP